MKNGEQSKSIPKKLEVSSQGEVRNAKTKSLITPFECSDGTRIVSFSTTSRVLHWIVAEAFIPNPYCWKFVYHLNGDKSDNRACNLRWYKTKNGKEYVVTPSKKDLLKAAQKEKLKPSSENKKPYGFYNNVFLYDEELESLKVKFPEGSFRLWSEWIEQLSEYMERTGKTYRSHYLTILNWDRREEEKRKEKHEQEDKVKQTQETPDPMVDVNSDVNCASVDLMNVVQPAVRTLPTKIAASVAFIAYWLDRYMKDGDVQHLNTMYCSLSGLITKDK